MPRTRARPDPVDRLAAQYQQARLLRRRRRRELADAAARGSVAAIRAAQARYRSTNAWERRCLRRYLRAVLVAYDANPYRCTTPAPSGSPEGATGELPRHSPAATPAKAVSEMDEGAERWT